MENNDILTVPAALARALRADEAIVNVTYKGQNFDLREPVPVNAAPGDIKTWATEAIRAGIQGAVEADPGVDLHDFVVDPLFPPTEQRPYNLISLRPKTPFGG